MFEEEKENKELDEDINKNLNTINLKLNNNSTSNNRLNSNLIKNKGVTKFIQKINDSIKNEVIDSNDTKLKDDKNK